MRQVLAAASLSILAALAALAAPSPAGANDLRSLTRNKNFDDLTSAEHTAAKQEAARRKLKFLRVCADPGNMPQSNDKEEGYQNKIIKLLVEDLGGKVTFFWRPYLERGLTRSTFENDECDILLDMPFALQELLTTEPMYKTTYVLATRADAKLDIKNLEDERLKSLRIGVFQHSGLREALARRGIKNVDLHIISHNADLEPERQPWRQVQKVIDKELDVAGVWGPFAGWLKVKGEPIVLTPVNLWDDQVPLEFELAIGMRRNDVVLKYMLDLALDRNRDKIAAILKDFGVPLVKCSRCAVDGDLPSHGSYYQRLRAVSQDRFTKDAERIEATDKASPDQVVTMQRVEDWLKDGADLAEELSNAILADDPARIKLLLARGAKVNGRDKQGYAPLHHAARHRNSALIGLLADAGGDPNQRDSDGYTPLLHAINRNHVPSVEMLARKGADLELPTNQGITPLVMAIGDGKLFAAKALIDVGAKVNAPAGAEQVTPLMAIGTQLTAQSRSGLIAAGPAPADIVGLLLEKGADINGTSKEGVTALMVAAGHNNTAVLGLLIRRGADPARRNLAKQTALDIAELAGNSGAIQALKFLQGAAPSPTVAPTPAAK